MFTQSFFDRSKYINVVLDCFDKVKSKTGRRAMMETPEINRRFLVAAGRALPTAEEVREFNTVGEK